MSNNAELERYANHRGYPEELPNFAPVAQDALRKIQRTTAAAATHQARADSLAAENERLRAMILDACQVFERYDLPEHALHYRRAINEQKANDRE